MNLLELEPQFIRYESRIEEYSIITGDPQTWRDRGCPTENKIGPREYKIYVQILQESEGIFFLCPKCFTAIKSRVGVHLCEVTFSDRGVPDELGTHNKEGKPTRWAISGDDFTNLSTQPSILLTDGCGWHGFITNGQVSIL